MPVNIDWMGYRYHVIHANFIDHWDWSDLHQALIKAHMLMVKSNHRISIVLDFLGSIKVTSRAFSLPAHGIFPLSQLGRFIIIVDEPLLAKELVQILRKLYPNAEEILAVSTYEDVSKPMPERSEINQLASI